MGRRKSVCVSTEKDHQYKELVIDILNDLKPVLWPQCCIRNNLDRMEKRKSACASTEKDHQCKELVIDILDDLKPVLWPQCCIYKVPRNLCEIKKEVYTPQLISIGPLHHDNEKLADMEMQKSIYLSEFFKRTKVTWKDFVSILKKDEERIRYCYAEKSKRCSNEYVEMILFDAVFIMELFIRNVEKENHQDDYMLEKLWLRNGIQQDLLLLENQLPYFVFDALFKLAFPDNYQPTFHESSEKRRTLTFHELTCKYFKNYNPSGITILDQKEVLHFTDLFRYLCLKMSRPEP